MGEWHREIRHEDGLVQVQDEAEAPQIQLDSNPGFYILATDSSRSRDTGYRVFASDDDGDEVSFKLGKNARFKIVDGNKSGSSESGTYLKPAR